MRSNKFCLSFVFHYFFYEYVATLFCQTSYYSIRKKESHKRKLSFHIFSKVCTICIHRAYFTYAYTICELEFLDSRGFHVEKSASYFGVITLASKIVSSRICTQVLTRNQDGFSTVKSSPVTVSKLKSCLSIFFLDDKNRIFSTKHIEAHYLEFNTKTIPTIQISI